MSPPAGDLPPPPTKDVVPSPPRRPTPPRNDVTSPPAPEKKQTITTLKNQDSPPVGRIREIPARVEKLSLVAAEIDETTPPEAVGAESKVDESEKPEESNGVGDKIKKFEKAAEDASAPRSRPGSVRRTSSTREDLPPPATPFKDNVHFDLAPERPPTVLERQQSLTRSSIASRWPHDDSTNGDKIRPEPQKIIKPEFKPMPSPIDVTIRSPSLGAKIADRFPSHGTAFRNVASPDPPRPVQKLDDDNTQNNFKTCKVKKEKYSVSKGSSYFTRGSEEIWLVKKKDIEEIEERVLDSFRRAGGNLCMRSESMRPASDGGQSAAFAHATMGRSKRQLYARSESLEPAAGARAHTLKRQTSVACTCGHDKKARARPAPSEPRARSRSHGDDAQAHVLDKYETLV